MLLYLCDRCGNIVPEDIVLKGQALKKHGILCQTCWGENREEFVCDSCNQVFSARALRNGDATLIPKTSDAAGMLLCRRCSITSRSKKRELRDMKYLTIAFLICILIPLAIGGSVYVWRFHQQSRSKVSGRRPKPKFNLKTLQALRKEVFELRKMLAYVRSRLTNQVKKAESIVKKQKTGLMSPYFYKKLLSLIPQKAMSDITKSIQSGRTDKKIEAILKVSQYRERAAIPFLEKLLDDQNPVVRGLTSIVLGNLGSRRSITRLLKTLRDDIPFVRRAAAQALSKLTHQRFIFFKDLSQKKWKQLKLLKKLPKKASK